MERHNSLCILLEVGSEAFELYIISCSGNPTVIVNIKKRLAKTADQIYILFVTF